MCAWPQARLRRVVNKPRPSEHGASLIFVAAFLLFVGLPLLTLIIDGTRLYRVRSLLQVATDAACEDAALAAPDFAHYKETGETQFLANLSGAKQRAVHTFQNVFQPGGDTALDLQAPSLTVSPDYAAKSMDCSSSVDVPLIMSPATITVNTTSTSSIRFSSQ